MVRMLRLSPAVASFHTQNSAMWAELSVKFYRKVFIRCVNRAQSVRVRQNEKQAAFQRRHQAHKIWLIWVSSHYCFDFARFTHYVTFNLPGFNSLPRANLSDPLSNFTDQAAMFENGGLPTVNEESRNRLEPQDTHIEGYYRESYDPEQTDMEGGLNVSQATFIGDGVIPLPSTAITSNGGANESSFGGLKSKKFSLINIFIPSFIFVILAMTISAVLVLESEHEMLAPIRNWPEMSSLRHQYYEPLKEFITSKFENIFWSDDD